MANDIFHFMVEFTMPAILTDRFTSLIPDQRTLVNRYFSDGCLVSYSVSLEKSRVWAVFVAETEEEVLALIKALPLTRLMSHHIHILTFYNVLSSKLPSFSVN